MTKRVMIDINCNPLVELKIIIHLCRGILFCVSSEIVLLRRLTEDLKAILLIGLLKTHSETE